LEIITKLAYSKSQAEYDLHYQDLLESGFKTVISYYNSNWHNIREEWAQCFKESSFTLGEKPIIIWKKQMERLKVFVQSKHLGLPCIHFVF
jgi:hypothetical protein